MLRVQLRRSRAENYFLQTSLGLFSSEQESTEAGSKVADKNAGGGEGVKIKWKSRENGPRNKERFFGTRASERTRARIHEETKNTIYRFYRATRRCFVFAPK